MKFLQAKLLPSMESVIIQTDNIAWIKYIDNNEIEVHFVDSGQSSGPWGRRTENIQNFWVPDTARLFEDMFVHY